MQHAPFPSTSSPLHDQRELASRLSSRVFTGVHPFGLQPRPDALSSNAEASTTTVVRSAASTRLGVVGAGEGNVVVAGEGVAGSEVLTAGAGVPDDAMDGDGVSGAGVEGVGAACGRHSRTRMDGETA